MKTKFKSISDLDVKRFIKDNNNNFKKKLTNYYNYSRVVSLANFKFLVDNFKLNNQKKLGVISGSSDEPELKFIKAKKICYLNYPKNKIYNLDNNWKKQKQKNFSMIICNQVLEHVFNPHLAFDNMLHHLKKGGYLYISIPTLNCIHGEPFFYSSGFHPRFLERIAKENHLSILNIGYWGSKKYLSQAVMGHWLCEKNLRPGSLFSLKSFLNLSNPLLFFTDGRKKSSYNVKNKFFNKTPIITDCWGLFKKIN